jgi:proteasome alpha subunit
MTMPFYVSPEQVMKDRADYAGRASQGRSLIAPRPGRHRDRGGEPVARCSRSVRSEPHRVAGVGKYNEFEMLKIAAYATPT